MCVQHYPSGYVGKLEESLASTLHDRADKMIFLTVFNRQYIHSRISLGYTINALALNLIREAMKEWTSAATVVVTMATAVYGEKSSPYIVQQDFNLRFNLIEFCLVTCISIILACLYLYCHVHYDRVRLISQWYTLFV